MSSAAVVSGALRVNGIALEKRCLQSQKDAEANEIKQFCSLFSYCEQARTNQ